MKTIVLCNADYDIDQIITWCYCNIGNGAQFKILNDIRGYPFYVWGYTMDFVDAMFIFKCEEDYVKFVLTWVG
jgi:hypothetical protein